MYFPMTIGTKKNAFGQLFFDLLPRPGITGISDSKVLTIQMMKLKGVGTSGIATDFTLVPK